MLPVLLLYGNTRLLLFMLLLYTSSSALPYTMETMDNNWRSELLYTVETRTQEQ